MLIDKIVLEAEGITSNLVMSRFNYLLLRGDDDGGSSAPSMVWRHNHRDDLYRFIVAATDDSPDHLMSLYNRLHWTLPPPTTNKQQTFSPTLAKMLLKTKSAMII